MENVRRDSPSIVAGERVNFKISAEAFNIFDHPQVFAIGTTIAPDVPGAGPGAGTNLGTIQQYRDQRTLQFGFRLQF